MDFPPISDVQRIIIWIITGVFSILSTLLLLVLERNIGSRIRRFFGQHKGKPPTERPRELWWTFFVSLLFVIIGTAIASSAPSESSSMLSPSPTATAFPVAATNEELLIIVDFNDRSIEKCKGINSAQRIYNLIAQELSNIGNHIRLEQYHQAVRDDREARSVLEVYKAEILVWGWCDEFSVEPRVIVKDEKTSNSLPQTGELDLFDPDEIYANFTQYLPSDASYMAFIALGILEDNEGNYDDAIKYFDKAIEVFSLSDEGNLKYAFALRGYIFIHKLMASQDAIADLNKAIELDPEYSTAYLLRGSTYLLTGNYERALIDFNKVIELDPEYSVAYLNRGIVYKRMGAFESAIEDYDKAIELNPEYHLAYINRGKLYYILRDYEQAIFEFDKAIELDPEYVTPYSDRGSAHAYLGNYKQAIADYDKAIELHPEGATAYFNRGNANFDLENYTEAIADYSESIERDSENVSAYRNRGLAYYHIGDYEKAIVDYNKALEIEPKFLYLYGDRGIAYISLGDYESAIADYSTFIEAYPDNAYGFFNRGRAYQLMGKKDSAIIDFRRYLELEIDPVRSEQVKKLLEELEVEQ